MNLYCKITHFPIIMLMNSKSQMLTDASALGAAPRRALFGAEPAGYRQAG